MFASQQANPAQTFPLRLSSDLSLAITWRNSARNSAFSRIVCVCKMVAWENSRYSVWETTAEIWPTLTSEKRLQKFHTDDVSSPRSGLCFWLVVARGKLLQPIRSTTQIWGVTRHHYANFHPRFLDFISRGNQWWHPEMSFFFSGSKMVDFLVITVFFSWPLSSGLYQQRKKRNSSYGSSDGGGFAEKSARPKSTH